MAEFNPSTNVDQGADWTGASRGPGVKKSFATLFEGATDTALGAVGVADLYVKETSKDEMQKSVDALDNEWLGGASAFETEINSRNIQPPPEDLQRYAENLQLNKAAYQAGTLRESAYQLRIDSIARQMRARFPGHREYIDTTLSQIVGRSTANDARKVLLAEWEAEQNKADDQTKFERQYLKENEGFVRPDHFEKYQKGEMSFAEVRANIQEKKAFIQNGEMIKSKLEAKNNSKSLDNFDVEENLMSEAANVSQLIGNETYNGINIDMIDKAIKEHDPSTPWDPEQLATWTNALDKLEQITLKNWEDNLTRKWGASGASYASKLPADVLQRSRDLVLFNIRARKEAIVGKDFALIGAEAKINKARADNVIGKLMTGIDKDYWRMVEAANQLGHKEMLNYVITGNPETLGNQSQTAILNRAQVMTAGDPTKGSTSEVLSTVNEQTAGKMEPQTARAVVKSTVKALFAPDATPEGKAAYAMKLFGKGNMNILDDHFENTKSRQMIFDDMTRKEVFNVMKELEGTHPEAYEAYRNWVTNQFHILFRDDVATMMDGQVYADSIKLTWDTNTRQIVPKLADKNPGNAQFRMAGGFLADPLTGVSAAWDWFKSSRMLDSMERLNKYAKVIDPIIGDGEGTAHALLNLMRLQGVDFDAEKKGSLLRRFYEAIEGASLLSGSADVSEEMEKTKPSPGTKPKSDEEEDALEIGEIIRDGG
jgi:hypothetical protein